jgi:hypothetical protein
VGSVPDPLLLRKCGSAGNRTRYLWSAARNFDHQTTKGVHLLQTDININVNANLSVSLIRHTPCYEDRHTGMR